MTTTTGIATDFIQFSRASNATVVDSDGKIKWAPHNLLLASEQFDASSWTKTTTTVTANSVAAPSGSTTAETLTAGGANSTVLQSYTSLGVAYTFGVWLKRKTGTGNVQIAADSGTYTTVTITSDWALYTVSQTPAAGTISAGIRIVTSADEVYAWGAHLYRSDLGGMQANASTYPPMYNPTTPKNLLGYTEDFSNASSWTKTNSTITANSTTSPNGLNTADTFAASATGSAVAVHQNSLFTANTPVTWSIYAKAGTHSFIQIIPNSVILSNGYANFDLVNGATGTSGGTGLTSQIVSVGNGWYRCSISIASPSATTSFVAVYLVDSATAARGASYGGSIGSYVYLWGAQLSDSASLDPYVPNYFAAPSAAAYHGPRLDYDPSTLAAKGLLVEEQRTNLMLQSAAFDNAAWTNLDVTVSANTVVAPDGQTTADTAAETTTPSVIHFLNQSVSVTSGQTYTMSVYLKKGGGATAPDWMQLTFGSSGFGASQYANYNISTGTVGTVVGGTARILNAGNGWYRVEFSATATATASTACGVVFNNNSDSSGRGPVYTGQITSNVYVWGAQFELGAFATSYFPTVGLSQSTRVADVASVATSAFPYGASEGSLIVSGSSFGPAGTYKALAVLRNTATGLSDRNPDMSLSIGRAGVSGPVRIDVISSGVVQASLGEIGPFVPGLIYKAGYAYAANDFVSVLNAGTPFTDTSGTVPTGIDVLNIGHRNNGGYLNGHIRQITYIPRRLTDAELQARTV